MEKKIKAMVIAEILNPTFGTTEKYLEVHNVKTKNGKPIIERIDRDKEDAIAAYVPIENEKYYLVFFFKTKPEINLSGISITAGNRAYLVVESKELSLKKLIKTLKIEPTESWEKGQDKKFIRRNKETSGFFFEPYKEIDELEDKIEKLLKIIYPLKDNFNLIKDKAYLGIHICYNGYKSQMQGWHIERETLKKLAELNLEIDLDLYASGPDLL